MAQQVKKHLSPSLKSWAQSQDLHLLQICAQTVLFSGLCFHYFVDNFNVSDKIDSLKPDLLIHYIDRISKTVYLSKYSHGIKTITSSS